MTPPKEWLKPPRTLLLILFLLTLVSISALGWFGWKLLDQERLVEAQRAREQMEQAADRIAASLRGTLAETGERLGAWGAAPNAIGIRDNGLLLLFTTSGLAATADEHLLYYPYPSAEPEARASIFSEAERFEFVEARPGYALQAYERLAESTNAAIRAGALVRLGRILRNTGRESESRAVYERLAGVTGAVVAGVPAELVGRHALCELTRHSSDAEALLRNLRKPRWHLTRGQLEFYWSEAARLAGRAEPLPEEAMALAAAAALAWDGWRNSPGPRGQATFWAGTRPYFLMWRGTPERRALWITGTGTILKRTPGCDENACAAADSEGRLVAGQRSATGHTAVRTAAETQLPWALYVTPKQPLTEAGLLARQRFLILGLSVMVLFLIVGTYFVARAIRRESEVLRMQSDFVSAVSHEFRSPLTSMRQLSEILALGRVPAEERRQLYYETLVRETARLQRLVEALLNFGKMEAGARQYRFEEVDTAGLVARVVAEFEPQLAGAGRHIEVHGPDGLCPIKADPEAISVALRNLVDNALKYSPGQPTVWVEWERQNGRVAIRVRDRGPGIAHSEHKAIFRKFVRGSAAIAGNVKGSGVGLAMVQHIVAAHGGEIAVASKPGQGSTFTMLLPGVERT